MSLYWPRGQLLWVMSTAQYPDNAQDLRAFHGILLLQLTAGPILPARQ
jgi:hypothetical protein